MDQGQYQATLRQAVTALQSGDLAAAIGMLEDLVRHVGDRAEPFSYLGYAYLIEERFTDAIAVLTKGLEISPGHFHSSLDLARAYIGVGEIHKAADLLIAVSAANLSDQEAKQIGQVFGLFFPAVEQRGQDVYTYLQSKLAGRRWTPGLAHAVWPYMFGRLNYASCLTVLEGLAKHTRLGVEAQEALAYCTFAVGDSTGAESAFAALTDQLSPATQEEQWFHDTYSEGLMATATAPKLARRNRFKCLIEHFGKVADLNGSVAECGLFRGLSAYVVCRTIQRAQPDFRGEGFYGFDSFKGLSEPTAEDFGRTKENRDRKAGRFAVDLETVSQNLSAFPAIHLLQGWIPDRFDDVADVAFKFVHIDVDLYQPSKDSLAFFYPRLVSGGLIVCDDYGWKGQAKAVQEFCDQNGLEFAVTPARQAVIQKAE